MMPTRRVPNPDTSDMVLSLFTRDYLVIPPDGRVWCKMSGFGRGPETQPNLNKILDSKWEVVVIRLTMHSSRLKCMVSRVSITLCTYVNGTED
jgi:hypothetical protein